MIAQLGPWHARYPRFTTMSSVTAYELTWLAKNKLYWLKFGSFGCWQMSNQFLQELLKSNIIRMEYNV